MNGDITVHKVDIRPIEILKSARDLMGDNYWLFVGICLVGMLIGSLVPMNILMGPMMCGIFFAFFKQMDGEAVEFGDLFKGFDYFLPSFLVSIITAGIMLVLLLPAYFVFIAVVIGVSNSGGGDAAGPVFFIMMILFFLFFAVVMILLTVLLTFCFPLIVGHKLDAIQAIKVSIRGAKANFWGLFVYFLVCGILSFIAVLFCYLPVFLVLPLTLGGTAILYRDIYSSGGYEESVPPPMPTE